MRAEGSRNKLGTTKKIDSSKQKRKKAFGETKGIKKMTRVTKHHAEQGQRTKEEAMRTRRSDRREPL